MDSDKMHSSKTGAPRHDIYRNIHRALRACMGDTLAAVGCMDVADPDDLRIGLERLRDLLAMCDSHIEKETRYVHTAMEARRPGSTAPVAEEHAEHADSIRALRNLADGLMLADIAQRHSQAQRLYLQLALLVAENFEHMHIEEIEHNAVLWSAFSDDELLEIEGRIVASLPPAESARVMAWMLPNIEHPARVQLLAGARQFAPPEAFEGLLALARAHLEPRDWQKLEAALLPAQAA